MKRTISIVLGIATVVLPVVSLYLILNDCGWEGMKVIGVWTMIATVFAIKG